LRREYPSQPLPGVGAVIVRGSHVLLVKREEEPSKGLWSIPGGLVELGESVEDACRREVKEETGIDIQIEKLLDVASSIIRDGQGRIRFHYVLTFFLARPLTIAAAPHSDVSEVRWVRLDELQSYQMAKAARDLLPRVGAAKQ